MKKTLIIEKRKKAKELRARGWSIRKVASNLVASKDSVSNWDKMSNSEMPKNVRHSAPPFAPLLQLRYRSSAKKNQL